MPKRPQPDPHPPAAPLPVTTGRGAVCFGGRASCPALAVDDLRDSEGFEAFDAELQAVAGLSGSTEGDAGVHGAVLVNPYGRLWRSTPSPAIRTHSAD